MKRWKNVSNQGGEVFLCAYTVRCIMHRRKKYIYFPIEEDSNPPSEMEDTNFPSEEQDDDLEQQFFDLTIDNVDKIRSAALWKPKPLTNCKTRFGH